MSWLQHGDLHAAAPIRMGVAYICWRGDREQSHREASGRAEAGPARLECLRPSGDNRSACVRSSPTQTLGPTPIPIGKAMPNYSVYIMDEDNHPLPAGVPGQIVIGGAGIASGYINQPELTAIRFPKDSLASPWAVANGWIYAHLSGDRGYMQEDGVFVALGRIDGDTHAKLRGQRFELREVEAAMVAAGRGDILEAVAHIRHRDAADASSAFLVAHVVLAPECQRKHGTNGPAVDNMLRSVVSGLPLPQYMRPSVVVSLPSMPLNHHGKVDRKFLSKSSLRKPAEPPKTLPQSTQNRNTPFVHEIERIWREVLGDLINGQTLDENSDFFLIGGNSLLLIKVQSKIKERIRHNIPLVDLFEASTLGKMAALVSGNHQNSDDRQEGSRQNNEDRGKNGSSQDKMKHIWLSVLGDLTTEESLRPDSDFFLVGGIHYSLSAYRMRLAKKPVFSFHWPSYLKQVPWHKCRCCWTP